MTVTARPPPPKPLSSADIASFTRDPLRFVRYAYSWGEPVSSATPPAARWRRRSSPPSATRCARGHATHCARSLIAVASGHGVGKSALVAWIVEWALATHEHARVIVTANTGGQLQTKTWPEIAKWFNLLICRHWFELAPPPRLRVLPSTRRRGAPTRWTWERREHGGLRRPAQCRQAPRRDLRRGEHDRRQVWEVTEGALSDEATEILWIVFGNPTRNSGASANASAATAICGPRARSTSRTVPGTTRRNRAMIETYGEDSDFVRGACAASSRASGSLQFIGSDLVGPRWRREVRRMSIAPVVIGVDVARFGDDKSVIYVRRGLDGRYVRAAEVPRPRQCGAGRQGGRGSGARQAPTRCSSTPAAVRA